MENREIAGLDMDDLRKQAQASGEKVWHLCRSGILSDAAPTKLAHIAIRSLTSHDMPLRDTIESAYDVMAATHLPMSAADLRDVARTVERTTRRLWSVLRAMIVLHHWPLRQASRRIALPNRTVTVFVGFDVGGVTDLMARLASKKLSEDLGKALSLKTGSAPAASSPRLWSRVRRRMAIHYSCRRSADSRHAKDPAVNYDPISDFAPISSFGSGAFVLTIKPTIPAKTIPEFVEYAKTHSITYGSPAPAPINPSPERIVSFTAGIEGIHVPFLGGDQALMALLGGQIDMYFSPVGKFSSFFYA